jgi:FkbM family methyltransferase
MQELIYLFKAISNKFIVIFGTGTASKQISNNIPFPIHYYLDNNPEKWGTDFNHVKVYNPSQLLDEPKDNLAVIVASMYYEEIADQLIQMGLVENQHFWNGYELFLFSQTSDFANDISINSLTTNAALYREKTRGTVINTVIDVGASNGQWSKMASKYFSDAFCYLIEAQDVHMGALKKMKASCRNVDYIMAAAGKTVGSIYFDANDPFGGVASYSPNISNCITVPVTTVDHCVEKNNLKPPFLLKLDTHGFEVPIFEGAKNTLRDTAIIVVEVYNFKLGREALRFHEMCAYLEKLGFWLADICDPLHRPTDHLLWQMDFVFISKVREEFKHQTYTY